MKAKLTDIGDEQQQTQLQQFPLVQCPWTEPPGMRLSVTTARTPNGRVGSFKAKVGVRSDQSLLQEPAVCRPWPVESSRAECLQ